MQAEDTTNPAKVNMAKIFDNGKDITDKTADEASGAKIVLDCGNSLNKAMTAFVWTKTGAGVIANYVVSKQTGTITPFDVANLKKKTFPLYDVMAETVDLTVTITLADATTVTGKASIKFSKPEKTFTGKIDVVQIVNLGGGKFELSLGNFPASKPGALFTGGYTPPPSGTTATFQFIESVFTVNKDPDGRAITTTGTNLSDNNIPYKLGTTTIVMDDTPGEPLNVLIESSVTHASKFKTWLMFKPDSADSIYVPLKSINWEWGGVATLNAGKNGYDLTSPSQLMAAPVSQDGMPPTWTKTAPEDLTIE